MIVGLGYGFVATKNLGGFFVQKIRSNELYSLLQNIFVFSVFIL